MSIQSSPSRGTFISFVLRRKARYNLEDIDKRFEELQDQPGQVLVLGLNPETCQFLTFLCKDIGVQCTYCCCIKQIVEELSTVRPALRQSQGSSSPTAP